MEGTPKKKKKKNGNTVKKLFSKKLYWLIFLKFDIIMCQFINTALVSLCSHPIISFHSHMDAQIGYLLVL